MANKSSQEQTLIQQAQQGNLDTFNQLVYMYQDTLYTIAYRIMGEPDSAADATQDALVTAYRKIDTYRGGKFSAWLARIVTNTCYDELRRRQRQPATYLEELPQAEQDDGATLISSEDTPEEVAIQNELQAAIQQCINALKDDQRIVLVLSDVQGMTYQEIADTINIQIGTVKSRLSRARKAVQLCLQVSKELLPVEYRLSSKPTP